MLSQRTNHNNFWGFLPDMALKPENVGPTFSSFNTCPSLPPVATGEGKRRNKFAEWHVAWLAE